MVKYLKYIICLLGLLVISPCATTSVTWNGQLFYKTGYSNWMTKEKLVEIYGEATANVLISNGYSTTVYFTPEFQSESSFTSSQSQITSCDIGDGTSCNLRVLNRQYASRFYDRGGDTTTCGNFTDYHNSYSDGCGCYLGTTETGYCVESGKGMCGSLKSYLCKDFLPGTNKQYCYWIVCGSNITQPGSCNSNTTGSDRGCGVAQTTYVYKTNPKAVDRNDTNLWKATINGPKMAMTVYSVPLEYTIAFDDINV